ncbi:hypothetical protein GOP47_0029102 [Adiantum capillus-veneris]|nr:hypothetical protein GOP47_0029102 [Adiantum capillus-veneris]
MEGEDEDYSCEDICSFCVYPRASKKHQQGWAMLKPVGRFSRFLHLLCLRLQGTILSRQPSSVIEPGKTFESMNMDEFMKNLWTAEDSKAGVGALTPSATENNAVNRQNSLSIPSALSSRTVEDVWRNIQKQSTTNVAEAKQPDHQHKHHEPHQRQAQHQYPHHRQVTLGEMTLEDFLVRTGVVRDDPDAGSHTAESSNFYPTASTASIANGFSSTMDALTPNLQHDWINFHHRPHQHQQMLQQAEAIAAAKRSFQPPSLILPTGNPIYDGLADTAVMAPEGFASSLALSPSFSDYSMQSRKRFPSEVAVEKTMERRQKRMIKNRESAARSRARKQAYTVELEAEVTMLKEENARLKQQQAVQTRLPEAICMQNTKMRVLRRTQSF